MNSKNILGHDKIERLLIRFAIPSIVAMLVSALYNIVDQFFIGRSVGMLGNAATNVSFPLTITCTALALLGGIGGAANFNLAMGRGEPEKAQQYAGNTLSLLVFLSVLLALVARIFLEPLMLLFAATDDVLEHAMTYTGITALGFPFLIFSVGGANLIRADGSPRFSMICTLVGAIINTILDALFVLGFNWGMAGAAWATVIGQIVSAAMVIGYLPHFKTLPLRRSALRPRWSCWRDIISLGMSPFLNQMAMMVVQVVMNNTLTFYGASSVYGKDIPLACAGIISKVGMVFFSVIIGLSQGLQPIISFNYGAQQYGRVREAYLKTLRIAVAFSCIAFLCFQILPRQIIGLFSTGTESEEYFRFAEEYFRIYFFFTFINCIQPLTATFFTAIGKASRGIFISLTRQIIFLLPLLLLLPAMFGIDGVMFAGPVADMAAATMAALFMRAEFRRMKAVQPAV